MALPGPADRDSAAGADLESPAGGDFAASAETLRKYSLIRCGYADLTTAVAYSAKAAIAFAAQMGDLARRAHGYCIVKAEKRVVRVWTPKSQTYRAMPAEEFYAAKKAITEFCADLLGVTVPELEAMGRREEAA